MAEAKDWDLRFAPVGGAQSSYFYHLWIADEDLRLVANVWYSSIKHGQLYPNMPKS